MSKLLEKQLNELKEKQKQELDTNPALRNVQKLLDYDSAEDRAILRAMGIDSTIVQGEQMRAKAVELENFNKQYGQVFHVENIKQLCMNYRLRFLNSDRYKGEVDVEVTAKIKEFAKKNNIELTDTTLQYKFFVLAPAEMFDIEEYDIPEAPKDPMLFYKIDSLHYRLIHKWGNDFSPLRAILGWKWMSQSNYYLFAFLISLVVGAVASGLIGGMRALTVGWWWVPQVIVTVICHLTLSSLNSSHNEFMEQNLTINNWMDTRRRRS